MVFTLFEFYFLPSVGPQLLLAHPPTSVANLTTHNTKSPTDLNSNHHLKKHIQFLTTYYASTIEMVDLLLKHQEITYELLWTLFPPNTLVYTTCEGSGQPKSLIFDKGKNRTASTGVKYFRLECRYLDYDGKLFGE